RASRQTDGLVYGLQSRRKGISTQEAVQLTKLWRCENADAAMLRVMEGFMEASPQILLQLYIIFTQPASRSPSLLFPQYASCATSLLSIACCLTTYQVALRSVRVEKRDMQCCSPAPPLFFAWKLCFLSSRLLALALLAVGLRHLPAHPIPPPWPFFACLLVHWLVSFVSLVNIGTTFCTHTPGTPPELAFDATLAVMHCFDVINVREGHSRWYYTCWYTAIFIENVAAAFVWLSLSGAKGESSIVYPLVVIIMFLVGLLLMICYYKLAHPALAKSSERDLREKNCHWTTATNAQLV
uniref:XK-related protein n=1 Tax=Mesocestoides corti TaxID=53468 RepID=A0A5K3FIZ1_MESCO